MFESEVNPEGIKTAELVVAIPSYNEADCIDFPTTQASEGIVKFFPDKRAAIIK